MAVTPYMNLSLPTVSSTPGPQWASLLNAALGTLVDAHDHTTGKGASIPGSALSITTDVAHGNANITNVRSVRLYEQSAPLSLASDAGCLYVSGGNLYYNSGAGQQVQITAGGGLNASSIGGIGGDYVTSGASVFYTAASTTFSFWSAANKSANLDCGKVIIREPGVTSPYGITIQSPTGLAAAYSLTLPAALPASTKILTVTSAGVVGAAYDVDGSTLEVNSNSLRVKAGGLTTSHLSASAGIVGSQLSASAGIVGSQIASSVSLSGSPTLSTGASVGGNVALTGGNPSSSTGFTNTLTPSNIVKAWGHLDFGTSPTVTVNHGFNIASASYSTYTLTINLTTALSDANYAVVGMVRNSGDTSVLCLKSQTASSMTFGKITGGAATAFDAADFVTFLVVGLQ